MRKHSSSLLVLVLVSALLYGCKPVTQLVPVTLQPIVPSPVSRTLITPIETPAPLPTTTLLPVTAEVEPVTIIAFCTLIGKDPKTYAPQGTPIIIVWGWEAKTETQIHDFVENNLTTITLDGKVIEGTLNSAVTKNEKSGQPEVAWFSEVGVLDPGQHVITYDVKWKKMVDDGTTTYGPGSKNETLHDECQIVVQ